jgi:predicted nucleotidyltransferase
MSASPNSTPVLELSQKYAAYLPGIHRRWRERHDELTRRRNEAWGAARRIATLLRARYDATQVVAFGSIVHPERFDERSDIDLAVAGISPDAFFGAWAAAGADCAFSLDLVDLRDCSPALRKLIEQEGVSL